MENKIKDMRERSESSCFTEVSGVYEKIRLDAKGDKIYAYICESCGWALARTLVPMEAGGIAAKKRYHRCYGQNKMDFEEEVR